MPQHSGEGTMDFNQEAISTSSAQSELPVPGTSEEIHVHTSSPVLPFSDVYFYLLFYCKRLVNFEIVNTWKARTGLHSLVPSLYDGEGRGDNEC